MMLRSRLNPCVFSLLSILVLLFWDVCCYALITPTDSLKVADSLLQVGEREKAKQIYDDVLADAVLSRDTVLLKRVSLGMARYSHFKGEIDEALRRYLEVLDYAAKADDSTAIADASMGIGIIHAQTRKFDEAMGFLQKALLMWPKEDVKRLQMLVNLGNVYLDSHEESKMLDTYRQALSLADTLGAQQIKAVLYTNLSNHYTKTENWPEAIANARHSLHLRDSLGQPVSVVTHNNLGYALVKSGSVKEGVAYYKRAMPYASDVERQQLLYNLKDAAMLSGDYRQALTYFEAYDALKDSIASQEYEQRVTEIAVAYETAEKENRISTLESENRAKARQITWIVTTALVFLILTSTIVYLLFKSYRVRRELEHSRTKARLLQVQLNPHFIFNALQHIQQYLYKNDRVNSMDYLSSFAKVIRLILEHSDKEWVELEEEVEMLAHYLRLQQLGSDPPFQYGLEVDPLLATQHVKLPVMLLQPFVENAVIHGAKKREGGWVTVSFSQEKDHVYITVIDNGKGMNAEGDNSGHIMHRSMGMKIVRQRIVELNKQYEGKIVDLQMENASMSAEYPGTVIHLRVALRQKLTAG